MSVYLLTFRRPAMGYALHTPSSYGFYAYYLRQIQSVGVGRMTVILVDADYWCGELEEIHYLAEILAFQDESECAVADGGIYVELDIVYLLQTPANAVDRLILENQDTIAP